MPIDDHRRFLPITLPASVRLVLLIMTVLVMSASPAPSAAPSAEYTAKRELQIKAAYLYHFAKFVQWPVESPASPLVICVIGRAPLPFTTALAGLAGKMVRNRRIAITYLGRIEDLAACDVLFVSSTEKANAERIVAAVGSRPILTVSDQKGFVGAGGIIGFVQERDRVRFQINQRASQRSNLRISAQLLKLATLVVE